MTALYRKLRWWADRKRREDELREELQFHLDEEADERREDGLPDEEAMRAARRDLGNVTLVREETRRLWTWNLLEQFGQDARYAARALTRSPGFAATAIVTLALGIGVNTAIFSVVNAVVLRPLPYRDPASLVLVDTSPMLLAPSWLTTAWRDRGVTLTEFAGFNGPRAATLFHSGMSQQIDAANVTWNFLSFLGIKPATGRDFVAGDADRGASVVGILTHEFWQRAFASDPAVTGKTLRVSGRPVVVVGIAPPEFRFPTGGALPATGMPPDTQPDILLVANARAPINVIGRLAPGMTPAIASTELLGIFKQEAATQFRREVVDRWEIRVAPLQDRLIGNVGQRLWLVMGAVAFVLLIACANVANLLLARASTRQRELALRMALGAGRSRITRLVLTESIVLALFGSVIGLMLAYLSKGTAQTLLANRVPHVEAIRIDAAVFTFNLVVALACGMFCGLLSLPGLRGLSVAAVSDSGAHAITGRNRLRQMLLAAETAVTFVLFVGAVLLGETLWNLSVQNRGFDGDHVLTVRVAPGLPSDLNASDRRAGPRFLATFFTELRRRLEGIPGVVSAGAVSLGPLEGFSGGLSNITVDGRTSTSDSFTPIAFVTPGYFRTMRIAMINGRDFTDNDRLGTGLVVVVNEAFQRRFAPDKNILGAHVTSVGGPEVFTIVGITRDVPDRSLRKGPEPLLIAPLAQMPDVHISWAALTFVLRTVHRDPLRIGPEVQHTIWTINPDIVITDLASMNARVAAGMRSERDSAILFGLFGFTALIMAAIGVYGVAAYAIAQRTKEIGIRVALGAGRHDIRRLVMSQTARPTLTGLLIGVVAAAMLTRFVASMVYGIAPSDPLAFTIGALMLAGVALAATWMPARRATQIDPVVALRFE